MSLLDGGLAGVFSAALSSIYMDATLHRATVTDDGQGGGSVSHSDVAVKAQLDAATQAMREAQGYTDTDQRILVLASGIGEITTDDEITVDGRRWSIASVQTDPVQAYFDLRGRLSAVEAS